MSDIKYNLKNPGVKRIMQEAKELANDNTYEYSAFPLEENIFEWHFTVRGPKDTEFEEGRYHGRILLPTEYPFKPPEIIFLTANGRFQLHTKICLSITGFHPEYWQPAWGIRTVLLAIIGFFPTESRGAIGGLDYPKEERQRLAKLSVGWTCPICGINTKDALSNILPEKQTHLKEELPEFVLACKEENKLDEKGNNSNSSQQEKENINSKEDSKCCIQDSANNNKSLQIVEQETSSIGDSCQVDPEIRSARVIAVTQNNASPATTARNSSQAVPLWLDALIAGLVSFIIVLIYRKYSF
ncbi:ubiquitin-conjugating enzyme/RWD-like protein [Cokeromyces recurvatus]|uniref:ubiquitin-conjugating enzyme/RWD-like protein n=1 Tax=Cokeromyces recurvatus TaxID=90255 RepID=UPI002220D9CA|nr:ubiquitin-conjugating enzyme/RWD-like protein [Cokeromyces recurvatus]KAI7898780.1 ubiquitin-conjugating enzyme/RWD-like protein [Cokeromyces recurvatus]